MNALITANQYKSVLGIDTLTPQEINNVENLIKVISDKIETLIGYDLELQDRVEKINKNFKIRLWAKYPPIAEVTEFKINQKVIDADDYIFTKYKVELTENFCMCNCGCIHTPKDDILISYKSGYIFGDNGDVPYDLQYAVARMVQTLIMVQEDPEMLKYSVYKINDISYTYKDMETATLTNHIIPVLRGLMLLWQ